MLVFHVTPLRNVERIRREGLFPRVGRLARLAKETEPAVYCFPTREALEDALSSWLGDALAEHDKLAVLTLDVTGLQSQSHPYDFEIRLLEAIPASRIRQVENEFGDLLHPLPA